MDDRINKNPPRGFDIDKEYRLMKQMCKACHYTPDLNSLSDVHYRCYICLKKFKAAEYVINIYCAECARKYNVCIVCGAEMD